MEEKEREVLFSKLFLKEEKKVQNRIYDYSRFKFTQNQSAIKISIRACV
jgi:hypothetical protein